MTPTRYLLTLMRFIVLLMWTGAAIALPAAMERAKLSGLLTDPLVLMVAAAIATAAGVTTLFMRINTILSAQDPTAPPRPLVRPWMFAAAHIGGSYLAAVLALLLSSIRSLEADEALLAVLLLSFAGAKAVEVLAERYLSVVRLFPGGPPTTPPQG